MTPKEIDNKMAEALEFFHKREFDKASATIKEVLDFNIKNSDAIHILAQICFEQRNFDLAHDLLKEAIKLEPDEGIFWDTFGVVLNALRKQDEAEEAFQKAISLDPYLGRAYTNLGNLYLSGGETEKGIGFLKKALEINPQLFSAYLYLSKAKAIKIGDFYFCELERLVKKFVNEPNPSHVLHFSLAYVHNQADNTKEYFYHLKKANELSRDSDSQWRDRLKSRVKNLKEISTPEFLDQRVSENFKIITPIFIVGMPRSGTTLTDQIFATHSKCFGGDELQYFSKYLTRVAGVVAPPGGVICYPKLKMEHFQQVATLYQKRVQLLSPGTHYFSDKMPWNFQMVGMITKIIPWAKIIHIYRDPLDCGFSCYKSPLPKDLEFTAGMEDYAYYRAKYQEIMDFWQETIPDRFINLSYEKLVENPKKELTRVLDYCGLPWEEDLLNFHKTKRQVRTISSDQVTKPLNKSSIGKAMKYEKELRPMIKALKKYGLITK